MNDRFKELATEARLLTGWPVGEMEYQKFAELIVRECMRVADSHGKGWAHLTGTESNRIRQHFGIE